ncbi:MAG: SMC-Scp complex subunit ScpB, partial [Gammaproteobacteria bacterium]
MEAEKLKKILEAALMITESPLTLDRLMGLFEDDETPPKRDKVRRTLEELEVDYENAGIELVQVASGYRFQARAEVAPWMNRLFEERRPKYSRALLETIAIIAYRQPITRGEIESIRGVAVSTGIIRTLLEREWVRVVGHRDVPGKPAVYATTKIFLDYFNLASIDELPSLAELKDFDDINADLFKDQNVDEGGEGAAPADDAESSNAEPATESYSDDVADSSEDGAKDSAQDGAEDDEELPDESEVVEHDAGTAATGQDQPAAGQHQSERDEALETTDEVGAAAESSGEPQGLAS